MRGTNSVGPAVVRLDHFPIDPGFSTMTGLWFGICVTPNLDWFVLYTHPLIVVCLFLRMSSFTMSKLIMAGAKRWSVVGSRVLVRRRNMRWAGE